METHDGPFLYPRRARTNAHGKSAAASVAVALSLAPSRLDVDGRPDAGKQPRHPRRHVLPSRRRARLRPRRLLDGVYDRDDADDVHSVSRRAVTRSDADWATIVASAMLEPTVYAIAELLRLCEGRDDRANGRACARRSPCRLSSSAHCRD